MDKRENEKFGENEIKIKIDKDLKNVALLKDMFSKFAKTEKDSSSSKQSALNLINNIQEENTFLKDINNHFLSSMSEIEKEKRVLIETINGTLIESASYYPEKVKDQKLKISNLRDLKKQKEKTIQEINKAKNKNETETVNKLHMQLNEKLASEAKDIKILEEQVIKNEADRLIDQKYLLLHYVHSEIGFYCTSMQILTKLFKTITAIDPREALSAFVKTYKISTYREEELPKLFNYVVGNTQRKLDAIKIGNTIPPFKSNLSDNNLARSIINHNIPSLNVGSSSAIKTVNQIMNNDNIISNNPNINQIGKNPPGWLSQNHVAPNQSGFNRSPVPKSTFTSNNVVINNK